jgi:hypothetical protein
MDASRMYISPSVLDIASSWIQAPSSSSWRSNRFRDHEVIIDVSQFALAGFEVKLRGWCDKGVGLAMSTIMSDNKGRLRFPTVPATGPKYL